MGTHAMLIYTTDGNQYHTIEATIDGPWSFIPIAVSDLISGHMSDYKNQEFVRRFHLEMGEDCEFEAETILVADLSRKRFAYHGELELVLPLIKMGWEVQPFHKFYDEALLDWEGTKTSL